MGNNYFQPRTYTMPTAPSMPSVNIPTVNEFSGQTTLGTGFAGQSNSGTRQMLAGLIWGSTDAAGVRTPGVFDNMRTQMGTARDNTRAATAGFGGIRWVPDNPSTPQDESLIPQYDASGIGKNERGAVQGGQQQANARGMMYSSFGDQMVGAALQRVGEQARGVINQYAGQLNAIANQAQATAGNYLGTLGSLYGQDAQENATAVFNKATLDAQTAANAPAAPEQVNMKVYEPGTTPGPKTLDTIFGAGNWERTVSGTGKIVIKRKNATPAAVTPPVTSEEVQSNQATEYPVTNPAWSWKSPPRQTGPGGLDERFGYGNYLIVKKPGGGWTVRVKG